MSDISQPILSFESAPPAPTLLGAAPAATKPAWERLHWSAVAAGLAHRPTRPHVENAQEVFERTLSPLDRFAIRVTELAKMDTAQETAVVEVTVGTS